MALSMLCQSNVHNKWLLYAHYTLHASPGLNYKSLMSGEDPLSVLSPFLTASNIHTVANLASNIPNNTGGWLTPSDVYRHFAEKLFWEGEVQRDGGEEEGGCLMRYDSCLEYLSRLTASDLLEFVKGITVKKRALPVSTALSARSNGLLVCLSSWSLSHLLSSSPPL